MLTCELRAIRTGIIVALLLIVMAGSGLITSIGRTVHAASVAAHSLHASNTINWPTDGFDKEHSHFNPYENTINTSNVSQLSLDWTSPMESLDDVEPIVANGILYADVAQKYVDAINAATGAMLWSTKVGLALSEPAVANGVVYVGSGYLTDRENTTVGKLFALNAQTGATIWTYTFLPVQKEGTSWIHSSPVVSHGLVYVSSENGNLYAFTAAGCGHSTCPPLWKAKTGFGIDSSPAVDNGVVYVGSGDHNVYAFNAKTGTKIWSSHTNGFVYSSPTIVNGVVYVGSLDDSLYAFNAKTGTQLWKFTTSVEIGTDVAVTNGVAYLGADQFYALDAKTGALLWTTTKSSFSTPVVANGVAYVASSNALYAFNAAGCGQSTCSPLWTYTTSSITTMIVVNGMVYASVSSQEHGIDAFHLG